MPRTYKKINDWTLKKEKLLKYWQEECRLYKWLYTQNVEYYQNINSRLSIIGILLSVVTGATLINNSNDNQGVNPHLVLAFGLISVVSSFTQGLRQFLDLESKVSANLLSARQNSAIVIDIEEQLNLMQEERVNGNEFMKNIKARKNEIIQNAPIITRSRWTQLQKKIQRGEGVSFFNETVFKNYLENTVNIGDLKLETNIPDEEENKADSPNTELMQKENIFMRTRTETSSPQHSHSEDELIEELQVDNLGVQQLRSAFSQSKNSSQSPPKTSNKAIQRLSSIITTTAPEIEISNARLSTQSNTVTTPHKLTALLNYNMSRL